MLKINFMLLSTEFNTIFTNVTETDETDIAIWVLLS